MKLKLPKLVVAVALVASQMVFVGATAHAQPNPSSDTAVHFLVDVSGSMAGSKLAEAKNALANVGASISAETSIGLRTFAGSCSSAGSLLVPIGPFDAAEFNTAVQSLSAGGGTPTSAALRLAVQDFPAGVSQKTLVLIADGDDQCGNLCETVQELVAQGVDVTIQAVGIQVASSAEASLTCAAQASGGEYFSVQNLDDLSAIINEAVGTTLTIRALPQQFLLAPDPGTEAFVQVRIKVETADGADAAGAVVNAGGADLTANQAGVVTTVIKVSLSDTLEISATLGNATGSLTQQLYEIEELYTCRKTGGGGGLGSLLGLMLPGGTHKALMIKALLDAAGGAAELAHTETITFEGRIFSGPLLGELHYLSISGDASLYSFDERLTEKVDPDRSNIRPEFRGLVCGPIA